MNFTSHTVVLSDGIKVGNDELPLAETNVWKSIEKTIELFLPKEKFDYKKMRVADLGCLEGAYAVQFARMGFETVGIEARQESVDKGNFLKDNLKLDNLSFVTDDVRNMSKYGAFDIVLCYGLLYHLDDPAGFLKTIGAGTKKLLLLNTHFAPERDARYSLGPINKFFIAPLQKRIKALQTNKNYRLSRITQNEGYKGRWFWEWNKGISRKNIETLLWASYNNDKSFWLCKKDLTEAIRSAGFSHVFERFDFTGDIFPDNYTDNFNRTMFVGVKN